MSCGLDITFANIEVLYVFNSPSSSSCSTWRCRLWNNPTSLCYSKATHPLLSRPVKPENVLLYLVGIFLPTLKYVKEQRPNALSCRFTATLNHLIIPLSSKVNPVSTLTLLLSQSREPGETLPLWSEVDGRPWHLPQEVFASSPRHGWYIWRSLNGPKWDPGVRASSDHLAPLWVPGTVFKLSQQHQHLWLDGCWVSLGASATQRLF